MGAGFLLEDGTVPESDSGDGCTALHIVIGRAAGAENSRSIRPRTSRAAPRAAVLESCTTSHEATTPAGVCAGGAGAAGTPPSCRKGPGAEGAAGAPEDVLRGQLSTIPLAGA